MAIDRTGRVALVGAGPGDPDLLTVKAARLIGEADILFVDRLAGLDVLKLARAGAEIVPVGKSRGEHSVPQEDIEQRMIVAARAGKFVVRLKGGDPFIFGRGGEEVLALRAAGIDVEVVPGVSSALAAAASAQIPLTHRGEAQAVTFVTGHAAIGSEPDLDWKALARVNQTVVVFMGLGAAETVSRRLMDAGRAADTPVAVIENASRSNEIIVHGRLDRLHDAVVDGGITGPALLIIGEVAALGRDFRDTTALSGERRNPGLAHQLVLDSSFKVEQASASALGPDVRRDERRESGKPPLSDLWRMFS
jgi:uroporphyrin-III C-methyltransferase